MKKTIQTLGILICLVLALAGCTDIGIYAQIAVSEKIITGYLPQGITPGKVFHITGANVDNYDFFSSNSALWCRNITDRSTVNESTRWRKISLNGWSRIQSMDATATHIVLTMLRPAGNSYELGLFQFSNDDFTPADRSVTFHRIDDAANPAWLGDSSSFYTARVFVPDSAANTVYVNALKYDRAFGEPNPAITESLLYSLDISTASALPPHEGGNWDTVLNGSTKCYVECAASGGGDTLFSLVQNALANSDNGRLVDETGADAPNCDAVVRPVTGLSYIAGKNCFIAGGTSADASKQYPVYATNTSGVWVKIGSSSSAFRLANFLDVSGTEAAGGAGSSIILAGSSSFSTSSTNTDGIGYAEIDTSDANPENWVISDKNLVFAYSNNYLVSDLHDASIVALSRPEGPGGNYIYASSRGKGLWRINAGEPSPSWSRE